MVHRGLICLVAVSVTISSLTESSGQTNIVNYVYSNNGLGAYSFEFKTSDGTYRKEEGGIVGDKKSLTIRGEYGYLNHFGQPYSVHYVADTNGFQPKINSAESRYNDRRII